MFLCSHRVPHELTCGGQCPHLGSTTRTRLVNSTLSTAGPLFSNQLVVERLSFLTASHRREIEMRASAEDVQIGYRESLPNRHGYVVDRQALKSMFWQ